MTIRPKRPISKRCGNRSPRALRACRFSGRESDPRTGGLPLVAHNSPFDEGCLRAVFELYGMPYPGYRFYCTCRASRRTFGTQLPNHQLHTVSAACGFDLANHHHALADAEACARIALKIL